MPSKANFQVGLSFNADTSQAKKQIQALQNEFNKLATSTSLSSKEFGLGEANKAAAELAANLQTAINTDTGRLDLTKFQKNLQQSGRDLKDYGKVLNSLGPEGQKAFNDLTNAILQAEVPLTRANKLISNLWTSFKQTAKYQFTGSIYRGLVGGLQSAYHYAQDLNESLNNIRIVTGQGTEQMAKFAEKANEAARRLSVTTTDYTNGALIYYQQGLSDAEVEKRTDVTMKLANASGVSAETASEQLTAIWNNFAKGSENLEYFADVITALGASTASSTSEISEGLEKFAAIGESVGLSYEYAASALATVTATTRQSADVVGTAFKTLFARIQDLELGDTLEDGTTLGKYSQALAAVGVNIKESNGELKAMDKILNEMAGAWSTISKDQQVALAQTVAGTRQYTQLIALMENWGFMQQNLNTAYNSTGTLQEQADIYAEGWEAARDRVKAAAQGIYDSLIDDEFFIEITNSIEGILTTINNLIKGMGGLQTLLPSLISLFTALFGKQISASIENTGSRIKDLLLITQKQATSFKQYTLSLRKLDTGEYDTDNPAGVSGEARNKVSKAIVDAQNKYAEILPKLNEYEQKIAQAKLDALKASQAQIEANDKIINQKAEELQKVKNIAEQSFDVQEQIDFNNSSISSLKYDLGKGKTDEEGARQKIKRDAQLIIDDPMASASAKEAAINLQKIADSRKAWDGVAEAVNGVIKKLQDVNTELGKEGLQDKINKKANTITARANRFESAVALQGEFVGTVQGSSWNSQANGDIINKILGDASGKANNKTYSTKIQGVNKEIVELINNYKSGEPSLEKWTQLTEKLNEKLNEQANLLQSEGKAAVADYEKATGTASNKQELFSDATRGANYELNKQSANQKVVAQGTEEIADSLDKGAESAMSFSDAVTTLAGGLASIVALGRTLTNLVKTLSDENATGEEKLNAISGTLTSLAFTLPSSIKLFGQLNKGVSLGTGGLAKFATGLGIAKAGAATATPAITGTSGAIAGTGAAAGAAAIPLGTLVLILGGIIATFAGISLIIKLVNDDLNHNQIAAEEAAKSAKKLSEDYESAKTAFEDLKTTISDYEDGQTAMEKLAVGTEEYEQALNKANEAAEKLIEKYSDIEHEFDAVTGQIKISNEELEKYEKKQKEALNQSELAAKSAKLAVNTTQNQASLTKLAQRDDRSWLAQAIGAAGAGAVGGAKLGMAAGPQGILAGGAIGGLSGFVGGALFSSQNTKNQNNSQEAWLNKVLQEYKATNNFEEAIQRVGNTYTEALGGKNAIKNALDEIIKNQNDNLQIQKQLVHSQIADNQDFKNTSDDIKNLVTTSLATQAQNKANNYSVEQLTKGIEAKGFWGIGTVQSDKARLRAAYGEMMGYEVRGNGWGGTTLIKTNDDGTTEKIGEISEAVMRAALAQKVALEEVTNNITSTTETIENTISRLQNIGVNRDSAISFLSSWSNGNIGNLGDFTQQQLSNLDINSLGITDEIAVALGHKSAAELLKAIQERVEIDKAAFAKIGEGVGPVVSQAIRDVAQNDNGEFIYTLVDSQRIATKLNNAFISGGETGIKNLAALLAGQKDPIGILQALENTDWRNADLEELYKTLQQLGYSIDYSIFERFAQNMKNSAQEAYLLTASLEDLVKSYKELKDLLSKTTYGSIISDEDYQKLIKSRDDLKNKFIYTVDGWMFIGESEDLDSAKSLDIDALKERNKQGQQDVASANLYDFTNSRNSDLGWYSAAAHFTSATDEDTAGNFGFNKTAAAMVEDGLDEAGLKQALHDYYEGATEEAKESAKKIVQAYVNALIELQGLGDKYADKNTITLAVKEQYKTVDDLNKNWSQLVEDFGEDAEKYRDEVYETVLTNELLEKGIDTKEYEAYYKYLRRINPELANNITLSRQLALTNLTVQKGLENLSNNFDSYIEGLTEAAGSAAHQQALDSIRQDLANILSVQVQDLYKVDEAFIAENQGLIRSAADGNEQALMTLELLAAGTMQQLSVEEINALKQLQETIANTPIGATIEIGADLSGIDPKILDMLGLENYGGTWYNQGKWSKRANLKSLQKKAAERDKSSAGKSKTIKELDDELDRYHYIKKALEDIERELERVNKVKERAYGAQHLKYLDQEIQYLQEEVGLQDQYLSQIEGYLAKDRGLIAAYGAQFDAQGNISNYDQMFAANFNKYANADDSTNWENFKKAISKYEETMDLWQEQTEKRADLIREILDKRLEGISYKVDIEVALNDREIALLEHQLNRLDDAAYDTAEALANIGKQFEQTEESIDSVTNGIIETLKTIPGITQDMIDSYMAGDSSAIAGLEIEQGQIDLLEQYSDQLLELSDNLKQLHDDALQRVFDAFDAWGEKIDDHVAKFEHLNALIDNYQEIIGLLGQNNIGISNEFMREMRNQQITNLQGALDTRTQAKDNLAEQLAEARRKASEAVTDAEREDWEKVIEDLEDRLDEATISWQEAWIAALQANKEAFEATMQELVDSFDDYADELKRYDTAQERYLETYRQAYELSKLTREIENSINDQDSIKAKKELQKLEDKIKDIKESGRAISEDELGLLQKEYELRLAEIALEDAQNAKSLVRLSRDNEGNWGYVYTADQDKIAEAEQTYEDKLYEYMRQADTMAESASRAILTLNKEMAEALAALDVNAEDYEAKVAEITEFYTAQISYYGEQYGIATDAMNTVAKESAAKYKPEVVDIIESDNSGLQTNFDETVLAIIGDFDNLEDAINGPEGALTKIREAYSQTLEAFQQYQEQNKRTCELAGSDISELAISITGSFQDIKDKSDTVSKETDELMSKMREYLNTTLSSLGTFARNYSAKVGEIEKTNTTLASSIISLQSALQNVDINTTKTLQKLIDTAGQIATKVKEAMSGGDSGSGGGEIDIPETTEDIPEVIPQEKTPAQKTQPEESQTTLTTTEWSAWKATGNSYHARHRIYNGRRQVETQPHKYNGNPEPGNTVICAVCGYPMALNESGGDPSHGTLSTWDYFKQFWEKYDTGGYTGEWGSSGRIAVLHEKELVLNAQDTENILDAVSLVRSLTAGIGQMSSGLGNIGAGLNNLNLTSGTLDQNVSISASFPNVVDHNEIEEALNNLVNKASQYAFRENRIEPRYV